MFFKWVLNRKSKILSLPESFGSPYHQNQSLPSAINNSRLAVSIFGFNGSRFTYSEKSCLTRLKYAQAKSFTGSSTHNLKFLFIQEPDEILFRILFSFSSKGPEFWEATAMGEISLEDKQILMERKRENKELAEKFIDFMCRGDIALMNFDYITYSTPNIVAQEMIEDEAIKNSEIAFPDLSKYNLETYTYLGEEGDELYNSLWKEVFSQ